MFEAPKTERNEEGNELIPFESGAEQVKSAIVNQRENLTATKKSLGIKGNRFATMTLFALVGVGSIVGCDKNENKEKPTIDTKQSQHDAEISQAVQEMRAERAILKEKAFQQSFERATGQKFTDGVEIDMYGKKRIFSQQEYDALKEHLDYNATQYVDHVQRLYRLYEHDHDK